MEQKRRASSGLSLMSAIRRHKSDMHEEMLVRLGVKEEKFDWHPDILYRRPERPQSSVVADYSIDIKVGRPKVYCRGIRNPWACGDQALRQMTMTARQGPRSLFFSKRPRTTNVLSIHHPEPPRVWTTTHVRLQPISLVRSKTTWY